MSTDTYDDLDYDAPAYQDGPTYGDGPAWASSQDEGSTFEAAGPRRPLGPLPGDDDQVVGEDNRAARRAADDTDTDSRSNAAPALMILGVGATAVLWVFSGGFVAAAVGGVGAAVWVGNKLARIGAAARTRRDQRDERRDPGRRRAAREPRQPGFLSRMRGRGRARRDAAARRTGLLASAGAAGGAGRGRRGGPGLGGLGLGGGRRSGGKGLGGLGGGKGGGGGGRGPKGGPKLGGPSGAGRPAGGKGGGLRGLLPKAGGPKRNTGMGSGPTTPTTRKGASSAASRAPGRLAGLLPTRRGAAARAANRATPAAAAARRGGAARPGAATGRTPGRLAAMMPTRRGAAARAARRAAGGAGATGGRRPTGGAVAGRRGGGAARPAGGRIASLLPTRRGAAARAARRAARTGGSPAGTNRPTGRKPNGAGTPAGPQSLRQLVAARRQRVRAARMSRRAASQQFYLQKFWPMWGRRLRRGVRHATITPAVFAGRHLLLRPARAAARVLVARPSRAVWNSLRARAAEAIRVARLAARARRIYYWPQVRANTRARLGRARTAVVARLTPQWWKDLELLAGVQGRMAAVAAFFMLLWAGIVQGAARCRGWAIDGRHPRHAETGRYPLDEQAFAATPAHARADDQIMPEVLYQALYRPTPAATVPTAARRTSPTPAAASATTAPSTAAVTPQPTEEGDTVRLTRHTGNASGDLLQIPGGLHPMITSILEDACTLYGQFVPRSFADLTNFLASTPEALRLERDKWAIVGDNLYATFPGFNLAQEFAERVHSGYGDLATKASDVFTSYRALHASDFARHLEGRVNEAYADLRRWSGAAGVDPILLQEGGKMHGAHTLFLASLDVNLVGFNPADSTEEDRLQELRLWLGSLGAAFAARGQYNLAFVSNLPGQFPIEDGVADVMMQMARGFCDLADLAHELRAGYEARNPHDIKRREEPKVNEHLRDVGNTEVSYA